MTRLCGAAAESKALVTWEDIVGIAAVVSGFPVEDVKDPPDPDSGAWHAFCAALLANAIHVPMHYRVTRYQRQGWDTHLRMDPAFEELANTVHLCVVRLKAHRRRMRGLERLWAIWKADPAQPKRVYGKWQKQYAGPLSQQERDLRAALDEEADRKRDGAPSAGASWL